MGRKGKDAVEGNWKSTEDILEEETQEHQHLKQKVEVGLAQMVQDKEASPTRASVVATRSKAACTDQDPEITFRDNQIISPMSKYPPNFSPEMAATTSCTRPLSGRVESM